MRMAALSVALFCLLVSAEGLVLLFVMPPTLPLTTSSAGSATMANSWTTLLLLLSASAAATCVLLSLWRPGFVVRRTTTTVLAGFAATVAVGDYAVARYTGELGARAVPWLNITVLAVGILYAAHLKAVKRASASGRPM